ncbi:hypothetical protein [Mesorhizobium sp. M0136]
MKQIGSGVPTEKIFHPAIRSGHQTALAPTEMMHYQNTVNVFY